MRGIGEAEVYGCSDILCAGLRDDNAWVRFWAAHSARRLRSENCLKPLLSMLSSEPEDFVLEEVILTLSVIARTGDIPSPVEESSVNESFVRLHDLHEAIQSRLKVEEPFALIDLAEQPLEITYATSTDLDAVITEHAREIHDLATVFSQYQRPDGILITDLHVKRWLRQFNTPTRASYALKLLRNIDFYHRRRMSNIFDTFIGTYISANSEIKSTSVALLGNPTDSSSIVNYVIRDVLVNRALRSGDLKSILATYECPENIVFIDDNVGSGKQSAQIFHEWLSTGRRVLDEKHVVPLGEEEVKRLRSSRISILACVATRQGCDFVQKQLEGMGLHVRAVSAFTLLDQNVGCFHPTSGIFLDSEQREEARQMCQEIGECLLLDKNWTEQRRKEYALGYGNAQKLVVFFYNVPTTTLTILWKHGVYKALPWFPLFPRREKVDLA